MTPDEFRLVYDMFKQFNMTTEQRYYSAQTENLHIENQHHIKFASWVKQAYPDVWEAWRAVQDVGRV